MNGKIIEKDTGGCPAPGMQGNFVLGEAAASGGGQGIGADNGVEFVARAQPIHRTVYIRIPLDQRKIIVGRIGIRHFIGGPIDLITGIGLPVVVQGVCTGLIEKGDFGENGLTTSPAMSSLSPI